MIKLKSKIFKLKKGSLTGNSSTYTPTRKASTPAPVKEDNNTFYKRVSKENRDRLLANITWAEKVFYDLLTKHKIELEKQKVIFIYKGDQIEKFFIADFQIKGTKILVEIDGGYHTTPEQKIKDAYRTILLEKLGYRVLRYDNEEMRDLTKVFKKLNDFI